ncbi:MAG: hypothetical protein AAGI52_09170 [Bacteroidota bacterium]
MTPDRRRTLLLSVLAALAFWLVVDEVTRLPLLYPQEGFLAPIPWAKRLLLVAVVAGMLYAAAWLIALVSPKRWVRRVLWPVALGVLFVGSHAMLYQVAIHYSPFEREEPHLPLRFDQPTLAGTAWWNITGGDCGYFSREVLVFESETEVVRHRYGAFIMDPLYPVYILLGVWTGDTRTTAGSVRDGVIYWEDAYESTQRIEREGDGLRVTWAPELADEH